MRIQTIDSNKFYREHRLFIYAEIVAKQSIILDAFSGIISIDTEYNKDYTYQDILDETCRAYQGLSDTTETLIDKKNIVIKNVSILSIKDRHGQVSARNMPS
jgi:hypothetical protein